MCAFIPSPLYLIDFPKARLSDVGPIVYTVSPGGRFHGRIAHCFSRRRREPQRGFVGYCLQTTGKLVDSRTCFQPKLLSSISTARAAGSLSRDSWTELSDRKLRAITINEQLCERYDSALRRGKRGSFAPTDARLDNAITFPQSRLRGVSRVLSLRPLRMCVCVCVENRQTQCVSTLSSYVVWRDAN